MTNYFVTGATGWLGSQIVESLTRSLGASETVTCFVEPSAETKLIERFAPKIVKGDVRSADDCAKFFASGASGGALIHAAGIIHPKAVRDFYAINVQGTANVAIAAKQAGVGRAAFVSSNSPCGNNPHQDHRFDELSPYNPYMNYGRSKMKMEQEIHHLYQGSDIRYSIIRAPWFYGPNQPIRQTLFFTMVKTGKFPILGAGTNRRSMAYIENLVDGILLALRSDKASKETFWIADERPYSMNEIITTIQDLLASEFSVTCAKKQLRLPGLVGDVATLVDGTLQSVGVYHQKMHVLSEMNKTIACSIDKAKRELGYAPRFDLRSGMRKSLQWCFDNNIKI